MTRTFRPAATLLACSALALSLSGCKIDNRPLLARAEPPTAPLYAAGAPDPGPLDPGPLDPGYAPAIYSAPSEAYAYPARAYAMSRAFDEAPPSYAFGYGEAQPWVWDAGDQGEMFAEPIDDGWRYYYYEPGEPYPYFVQDPQYGYAYGDGGALIALFDAAGVLVSGDRYAPLEARAAGYRSRAYDMSQAYRRSPRHRVDEADWRRRGPVLAAAHDRWFQAAAAQPAWRQAAAQGFPPPPADGRHDNGRHLGWDKDRGRPIALAAPPAASWAQPRQGARSGARAGPAPQALARLEPPAARHGAEPGPVAARRQDFQPHPGVQGASRPQGLNLPQPSPAAAFAQRAAPRPEASRGPQGWNGPRRNDLGNGHDIGRAGFAQAAARGPAAALHAPPQASPQAHPGRGGAARGQGGGQHDHGKDHGQDHG